VTVRDFAYQPFAAPGERGRARAILGRVPRFVELKTSWSRIEPGCWSNNALATAGNVGRFLLGRRTFFFELMPWRSEEPPHTEPDPGCCLTLIEQTATDLFQVRSGSR